jgi:hypothetical protein
MMNKLRIILRILFFPINIIIFILSILGMIVYYIGMYGWVIINYLIEKDINIILKEIEEDSKKYINFLKKLFYIKS